MENKPSQTEEKKELDRYEKLVGQAHDEIAWIRNVYKWVFGGISAIFVVGVAFAVIFIGKDLSDIKRSINNKVDIIEKQVENRIGEEFKTKTIQDLIEKKVEEYIEGEAEQFITVKINKGMTLFQTQIENTLKEADNEVEKLGNLAAIQFVAVRAQNGSKAFYTQLKEAAKQLTPSGAFARARLIEIEKDLQVYRQAPDIYHELIRETSDGKKVPYKELSLDEIVKQMSKGSMHDTYRRTCMIYIKEKPKMEVFAKALSVFETSDYLPTCAAFCGVLSEISDEKAKFLDFDAWIKICKEQLSEK